MKNKNRMTNRVDPNEMAPYNYDTSHLDLQFAKEPVLVCMAEMVKLW